MSVRGGSDQHCLFPPPPNFQSTSFSVGSFRKFFSPSLVCGRCLIAQDQFAGIASSMDDASTRHFWSLVPALSLRYKDSVVSELPKSHEMNSSVCVWSSFSPVARPGWKEKENSLPNVRGDEELSCVKSQPRISLYSQQNSSMARKIVRIKNEREELYAIVRTSRATNKFLWVMLGQKKMCLGGNLQGLDTFVAIFTSHSCRSC